VEASIGRSEEPKYVKLDSQLPLLKGTLEEDIDDWFFTIGNYSKTRNIKDERKLLVFRGNALQIVKSMARVKSMASMSSYTTSGAYSTR
jgi:hypothetical protein